MENWLEFMAMFNSYVKLLEGRVMNSLPKLP